MRARDEVADSTQYCADVGPLGGYLAASITTVPSPLDTVRLSITWTTIRPSTAAAAERAD